MKPSNDLHNQHFCAHAFAKVNLSLAVGRVESSNGMHPIASWMHSIGLSDTIEIIPLDQSNISSFDIRWGRARSDCEQLIDNDVFGTLKSVEWDVQDDIVFKAHQLIEDRVDRSLPVRVRVMKHIPSGGGLGGGSSDAATIILGLNQLFDLGLTHDELVKIGYQIGSDVVFFIDQHMHELHPPRSFARPAFVSGFGDRVDRRSINHHGTHITLIVPCFGCPTGKVYARFDELAPSDDQWEHRVEQIDSMIRSSNDGPIPVHQLMNDLAIPARDVSSELNVIIDWLNGVLDQPIHVSGSGSTLFVIGDYVQKLNEMKKSSDLDIQFIGTCLIG